MKLGDREGLINTRPGHGAGKTRSMSMRVVEFAAIAVTQEAASEFVCERRKLLAA
jgi:hypothetical protein